MSMVRPPPGYIHRRVCTLEWCPGDFNEDDVARIGSSNKKQKRSHNHVDNSSDIGHKQLMDRLLFSDGDNEQQVTDEGAEDGSTWFLDGFPDAM